MSANTNGTTIMVMGVGILFHISAANKTTTKRIARMTGSIFFPSLWNSFRKRRYILNATPAARCSFASMARPRNISRQSRTASGDDTNGLFTPSTMRRMISSFR